MGKEKQKKGEFLKGAVWIAFGGFAAKIIGALYRIPLTNLIGGRGLGLYQMIYPVYCLLLTVSATGIPSSIAKLTAERIANGQDDRAVFKAAMKLFLLIGVFGTILMMLIAPFLSSAQGIKEVTGGYFTLAPSVFLVSAISVFRGWFQGRNKMYPTATSEILEQLVKVGFGLLFAYLYRGNIEKAVIFLLLSVTISEFFALCLMLFFYKREKKVLKTQQEWGRVAAKSILRLSIPVTLSAIILPLSALLDSVVAPRLLSVYESDAVTLFGLFSGGAVTVINLPVSVCYGIAAASVPSVAGADKKEVKKRIGFSLGITVLVGTVSFLGLYFFAEKAASIIFRSLTAEELTVLTKLIKAFSVSALTLSCVQTLSACLTAQGKPQYAALSMLIAVTVKTGLYVFWLRKPELSVFGLAWASNVCYLVAFFFNLVYNLRVAKKNAKQKE